MPNSIKSIRTIALVGQAGSGKTTLAECLLAKAGAVHAAGSVERGTTVCDYAPGEKQLRHSLKLAVASFEAKLDGETTQVHLLDTPGYVTPLPLGGTACLTSRRSIRSGCWKHSVVTR
jgi:elongation factor G